MKIIRLLTAEDAVSYKQLRLEALNHNPESFLATFDSENSKAVSTFATELRYAFSAPIFGYYGLFEEEKLIGYAYLEKSYLEKQQHIAFFYNLYIHHEYRGQGLAVKLFEFLMQKIKENTPVERIYLSCNKKNTPALALYKKLGFEQYAVKEKNIKWQGEYDDEIELVKIII